MLYVTSVASRPNKRPAISVKGLSSMGNDQPLPPPVVNEAELEDPDDEELNSHSARNLSNCCK